MTFVDACHLVLLTAQYLHNTCKYSILMPKLFAVVVICRFHWLYAWPAWLPSLVHGSVSTHIFSTAPFIHLCLLMLGDIWGYFVIQLFFNFENCFLLGGCLCVVCQDNDTEDKIPGDSCTINWYHHIHTYITIPIYGDSSKHSYNLHKSGDTNLIPLELLTKF